MRILVSSILLLLLFNLGWGDHETIRPTKERGESGWACTGGGCSDSTAVSDQSDLTYVSASTIGFESGFALTDFIIQQGFDSLQIFVRANSSTAGNTIALGWGCFETEFGENHWAVCNGICFYDTGEQGECSGADTVTLGTLISNFWVITLTYDPSVGLPWDTTHFNNSTYPYWHSSLLNLECTTVGSKQVNYVYEIWAERWWTPEAVPENKNIERRMRNLRESTNK